MEEIPVCYFDFMEKKSIVCKSLADLPRAAELLVNSYPDHRIFAFYGAMGAGKTTFIKTICEYLGVLNVVSSPSFSIVNEYATDNGSVVYHFDFYRIKNITEIFDIGYEDYFFSGEYCLLEWPEKIEKLLPEKYVYIKIEENEEDNSRILTFEPFE